MVFTKEETPSKRKPKPMNITKFSTVPKGFSTITRPQRARTAATRQEIHQRSYPRAFMLKERFTAARLSTMM